MAQIIPYQESYRDDMLFCLLLAKDALGRVPSINPDLLDISKNYLRRGDGFWLAIDENNRVVGMLGTRAQKHGDVWLKRLYIKPDDKRQGIASALLAAALADATQKRAKCLHTRFSRDFTEAAQFYPAKGFQLLEETDDFIHMGKTL